MNTKKTRKCIFCGTTPLTREHIIPLWIARLLVESPRGFPTGPQPHVRKARGPEEHRWNTDKPLDFVVNSVCERCNGHWMSTFETDAMPYLKPMIAGDKVRLNRTGQIAIAKWAILRAIITESDFTPSLPPMLRQWADSLYKEHRIPSGCLVWLAVYNGRFPVYFESSTITHGTTKDAGLRFSAIIGYLAVKVVGISWAQVSDSRGSAMIQISPYKSSQVEWPPPAAVTDSSFDDFCAVPFRNVPLDNNTFRSNS